MPARNPEDVGRLIVEAINNGDVEAVIALYEPGAVFLTQSGDLRSGTDAIRQQMAPFADMKPDFKINVDKVVSSGDIALMYNTWSMSNSQLSGRAIEVARRQPDGTWLYVVDDPNTLGA